VSPAEQEPDFKDAKMLADAIKRVGRIEEKK